MWEAWQVSVHGSVIEGSLLCCIPAPRILNVLQNQCQPEVWLTTGEGEKQEGAGVYLPAEQGVGDSWGTWDVHWGAYQTSEKLPAWCVRGWKERGVQRISTTWTRKWMIETSGTRTLISFSWVNICFGSYVWYFLRLFSFSSSHSQGL